MEFYFPEEKNLNIAALKRIFDDKSECYKLFWFKAILTEVKNHRKRISYNELICHMMSDAYYMVNAFYLNLGPNDSLEKAVIQLKNELELPINDNPQKLYNTILDYRSKGMTKLRGNLINDVPYCLQASFLDGKGIGDLPNKKAERIREMNREKRLLYYYSEYSQYSTEISIPDDWYEYLLTNNEILMGWTNYKMVEYLQRRNPTIPGIINKIAPPQERDLGNAKKFWGAVIQNVNIEDCYTGKLLNTDNFALYGRMEIDHFIPWSYIASDEVWNLTPTFKSVNGSKSNNLPELSCDIKRLAHQHHTAISVAHSNHHIEKLYKEFLNKNLNDITIRCNLFESNLSEDEYRKELTDIIEPIYKSASNAGYKKWEDEKKVLAG